VEPSDSVGVLSAGNFIAWSSCHLLRVMSGLIAFLQSELLSLSGEAKRKHPEIKEVPHLALATFVSTRRH
jgi:hypothetical protein